MTCEAACTVVATDPGAPAELDTSTTGGDFLLRRLADAGEDLALKRRLGDAHALGRPPTLDEIAIYEAAIDAMAIAQQSVVGWRPATWEEFADKSEALDRAQIEGCVPPGAGLQQLLADARRLGTLELPESAIPIWIRERERRRPPIESEDEAAHDARFDLLAVTAGFILRAPCSSAASGAAILRALLDPEIGLFETDISFFSDNDLGQNDQPALERVAAFLEAEATAGGRFSSRLAPSFVEAVQLADQAEEAGYTEDGETWLGEPLQDKAGELLDGVHLAPCTNRADALIKLGALIQDLHEHANFPTLLGPVTSSIASVQGWLAGMPAAPAEGVPTRAEYVASMPARAPEHGGPSLTEAALEVGFHHLGLAIAEYRARRQSASDEPAA